MTGESADALLLDHHPLMDTAASEAARQWVYEPAKYRDVPVYSVVYTGIGFRRIE